MLSLMLTRRFAPLFWCQFFSAFSDNFLKNALVFLLLYKIEGPQRGDADHADGAGVHRAVLLPVGARRRDRRPLRQGLGGAAAEARRDRRRLPRGGRLPPALGGAAVHRAVPVRRDRGAVRPDQIRHPARSSASAPSCRPATRWSRARPSSRSCSAPSSAGSRRRDGSDPDLLRVPDHRVLAVVLGLEPVHPADRRGRAQSRRPHQHRRLDHRSAEAAARGPAHLVGRDRHLLVLGRSAGSRSSLLPPLVKNVLGGSEEVATLCLAIFAISIAVGSGLAAWLAAGRIILLPTVLGAVLLGIFSFDLGFATWGLVPAAQGQGIAEVFGSLRGIRIGIDLAGLAIAGGLFIVPVFAAVQAWAGVDRRARVIAGVNVLNAAAMALSTGVIALLQTPSSAPRTPDAVHADGRRQPRRRLSPSARPCRRARSATRCRSSIARCSGSRSRAWRTCTRPARTSSSRSTT